MWTKLVDMEMDDEDQIDLASPAIAVKPRFPWGLRICLEDDQLKKLGLDADCDIGDVIDLRAFATVTSVSKNETDKGSCCRVELQIEKLAVENEMTEDEKS